MTNLDKILAGIRLSNLENINEVTIEVSDLVELANMIGSLRYECNIHRKNHKIAEKLSKQFDILKEEKSHFNCMKGRV